MPITIPPLRERREDIPILREQFASEAMLREGVPPSRWSTDADAALMVYHWPGNVRELRHVVTVAMIRAAGGVVTPRHLPNLARERPLATRWDEAHEEFRRRLLAGALRRNGGNRSATARELGISRQALLYHVRKLGLSGRD
jgi:Nif-specific regulatory protein